MGDKYPVLTPREIIVSLNSVEDAAAAGYLSGGEMDGGVIIRFI